MNSFTLFNKIVTTGFLIGLAFTGVASAQISLDTVTGSWINATSNGGPVVNLSGSGTNEIHWGIGNPNSGYLFVSAAPISGIDLDTPFALGTFTHYNYPIQQGNNLTNVDLSVLSTFTIDGDATNLNNLFSFIHNETPNTGFGNCCNDIVTFTNNVGSSTIVNIDGVDYVLGLIGFSQDGGDTLTSQFSTIEGQTNSSVLYAQISRPEVFVPEPSTYLTLASMLAVGCYVGRRKYNEKKG